VGVTVVVADGGPPLGDVVNVGLGLDCDELEALGVADVIPLSASIVLQKLKCWGLCPVGHGRRACVTRGRVGFRPVS
jgi:hypothetical protein